MVYNTHLSLEMRAECKKTQNNVKTICDMDVKHGG
jgi:hypothetical protein